MNLKLHVKKRCDKCGGITSIRRANHFAKDAYQAIIPVLFGGALLLLIEAVSLYRK